jgi:hypothetical protein
MALHVELLVYAYQHMCTLRRSILSACWHARKMFHSIVHKQVFILIKLAKVTVDHVLCLLQIIKEVEHSLQI